MRFSIIVPVYNSEKYLDKCLTSIIDQTNQDFELLIINDGSPDNSQEIITKYQNKYPFKIKSFVKENGGLSDARNYGVAKAITEHINLGNTYKEVKKVYSISILYFDLGKGSDYIYVGQNNFVGLHTQDHLIISTKEKDTIVRKSPSEIFPTYILVRVNEFNKVAKSPLEEWVEYLKNGVISPDTQAPGLQEAREKLKYYSMSDAERYAYDEHINAIMIQNDVLGNARLEGMEEGRTKEKNDIARKMLANGLSIEQIALITGLTEQEIKGL